MKRSATEQSRGGAPTLPTAGLRPAAPPVGTRPVVEPLRTRRRPLLVGLGVALTALGGLGAAWLATSGTGTVDVVGVRQEVRAGDTIERSDLVAVQVATGSGLRIVPVSRAESIVGRRTLVRLLPGSLLNPDAVADRLVPASGQALVGVSLTSAQRPAVPLDAGDKVRVVFAPGANDAQGQDASQAPVDAVVVGSDQDADASRTIVDVTVAADVAAKVATWSSAGHASIVLLASVQS